MAVDGLSLLTSLGVNGAICIVCIIIFSILRVRKGTRKFYAPKRFDPEVKIKPKRLPLGVFSWLGPVLTYDEDEIVRMSGMDVAVFLRLLNYGFLLFAFCTFWCCAVLLPINITAGFLPTITPKATPENVNVTGINGTKPWSDLDLMSTANIPPGSPRFWAHLISAYIVTIVAMALLFMFSKDVSRLRARYLSILPHGGTTHTILLTDIPGLETGGVLGRATSIVAKGTTKAFDLESGDADLKDPHAPVNELPDEVLDPWQDAETQMRVSGGDMQAMVEHEVKTVYGASHVGAVNLVYDTTKVEPLLAKYDAQKIALTDITDDYVGKLKRRKEIKKRKQVSLNAALAPAWAKEKYNIGLSGAKSAKVDALEYMPQNLDYLRGEILEQRGALGKSYQPAAFVTFNDRYTQTLASTGLHSYDELTWRAQPAPGADEIIWKNLKLKHTERVFRGTMMGILFFLIVLLYLPLCALLQAVVNIDNLKKFVPGIGLLMQIPFVAQIIQGILPGLVLVIFLILVPPILSAMARFQGMVSESEVDFSIVSRFFVFQMFATFIYNFLLGAAFSQGGQIFDQFSKAGGDVKDNPVGYVVNLLGVSAAQQASFFMSFIMIKALGLGMQLLRIVPLIIYLLKAKLAGTEKAKYRLWAKQYFTFGAQVANHTIIALLGLSYCCLAPLVAPFCLLYFALAVMSQKYQLVYVSTIQYDATGRMWLNCFNQIMVGIYFLHLMVVALLGVKGFGYVVLIIPLPIVTAVFHANMLAIFKRPWKLMSLKEAALLDARDGTGVSPAEAEELKKLYRHPVFNMDDEEHNRLITDSAAVDAALNGGELKIKDDMQRIDSAAF